MDKIKKIINNQISFLAEEQQKDGGFLNFTSPDSKNFKNAAKKSSALATALILSSLKTVEKTQLSKNIKKKAAEFLLAQKNDNWLFSDWARNKPALGNLDTTFCALSSLMLYDPKIIDGSAMAKILIILTGAEKKEGGPYYSWSGAINPAKNQSSGEIDLATNSNIAYFLSLQNVSLPNLNNLIKTAANSRNFTSPFYATPYPTVYFISRFFKSSQTKQIINFLLARQGKDGEWDNPFYTALAVSALLNFNYPAEKLKNSIEYLENCPLEKIHKPYAFGIMANLEESEKIYTAGPALTVAFYLEALASVVSVDSTLAGHNAAGDESRKNYNKIIKLAEQRFSLLDNNFRKISLNALKKIIKIDKDKQIVLLSHFFQASLGKKGKNIPEKMLIQLGLANLYVWIAYTIYDDFLDEEGDPKVLSTANVCLREFTVIFNNILPLKSEFHSFFSRVMDTLDSANAWETANCRVKIKDYRLSVPVNIPNYKNYDRLAERSLAHALGPLAILFSLGYKEDSTEVKNLFKFFKHYLIARQLNDDAHDWEDDLKKGHINGVVALILKKIGSDAIINTNDISKLQEKFWFKMITEVSDIVLNHTETAKRSLKFLPILAKPFILEKLLAPTENAAKKALKEHKEAIKFLRVYEKKETYAGKNYPG